MGMAILQGCSCKQQPAFCIESQQGLPSLTLEVFNILGLIEDHIVPLLATESKVILNHELVGCDADMEGIFFTPTLSLKFSFFLGAKVGQNL